MLSSTLEQKVLVRSVVEDPMLQTALKSALRSHRLIDKLSSILSGTQ